MSATGRGCFESLDQAEDNGDVVRMFYSAVVGREGGGADTSEWPRWLGNAGYRRVTGALAQS